MRTILSRKNRGESCGGTASGDPGRGASGRAALEESLLMVVSPVEFFRRSPWRSFP
jgi:hypothetical protein